jgi:uncharacterized protein YraI
MKIFKLASAALMLSMVSALAVQAAPGYSTANVNIRSGPDTDFPSVGVIPEGDNVDVRGCLNDESWCDVIWEGNRGWVFSEYLAFDYRGQVTPLPDVGLSTFSIPIVAFAANDYWRRHYVGRPWYKERDRWVKFKPRPRVGWKRPPKGPRKAGWWRQGYQAPSGMKAPPARGWKRPDRPGRGGPDRAGPRRDGPDRDGPGRDRPGQDRR